MRTICTIAVAFVACIGADTANAVVSPEAKCEAGKNQESGKYAFCLHKAEAKLLKTKGGCSVTTTTDCYRDEECPMGEVCQKDTTNYDEAVSKCENKYAAKWSTLEQKATEAMATCPDEPLLQADVKDLIDECVSNVASGLAGEGMPDCTGDLVMCATDLGTCNGSLSTCNGNYGICSSNLTACQGDLNDCQNPACGDNQSDLGEQCDGTDLNGATCTSLGFTGGTLACSSCAFDTTGCSLPVDTCGDGDIDGGEDCDGTHLNGGTCVGEGFAGGTLGCGASCAYSTSGCHAMRFVDNGNGTISDYQTGLKWEKKSDDGTIHDKDTKYTWSTGSPWNFNGTASTVLMAQLNDVVGGGANCFAGHCDWRLPTRDELVSIVDYADPSAPAVNALFDTSCSASCTVTSCSCTALGAYWSSSEYAPSTSSAWRVDCSNGNVGGGLGKSSADFVRAVRTGL